MSDSLESTIETNAQGPAKVESDDISVQQHSLKDQIAADKHLTGKRATGKKGWGLRFAKMSPSGAV